MRDKLPKKPISTRDIAVLSMFLAFALVLGFVERQIPIDFAVPGVRLGLANVVVLTVLYIFSIREAFLIVLLKCLATLFFAGSATAFIYSLSGSMLSLFLMALPIKILGDRISPIGVSVIGAVFHNLGQILAAAAVMRTAAVFAWMPHLMLAGVITGVIVGILVGAARRVVNFI